MAQNNDTWAVTHEDRERWERMRNAKKMRGQGSSVGRRGGADMFGSAAHIMGRSAEAQMIGQEAEQAFQESVQAEPESIEERRQRMVDTVLRPTYDRSDDAPERQAGQ